MKLVRCFLVPDGLINAVWSYIFSPAVRLDIHDCWLVLRGCVQIGRWSRATSVVVLRVGFRSLTQGAGNDLPSPASIATDRCLTYYTCNISRFERKRKSGFTFVTSSIPNFYVAHDSGTARPSLFIIPQFPALSLRLTFSLPCDASNKTRLPSRAS